MGQYAHLQQMRAPGNPRAHSRRYACLPALRDCRWSSRCVTCVLRDPPSFPSGHGPDDLACDLDGGVVKCGKTILVAAGTSAATLMAPARRREGSVTAGPADPAIQRLSSSALPTLTMIPRIAGPSYQRRTPSPATAAPSSRRRPARSALAGHTHGQVGVGQEGQSAGDLLLADRGRPGQAGGSSVSARTP